MPPKLTAKNAKTKELGDRGFPARSAYLLMPFLAFLATWRFNFSAHRPNRARECKRLYAQVTLRATLDQSAHTRQ